MDLYDGLEEPSQELGAEFMAPASQSEDSTSSDPGTASALDPTEADTAPIPSEFSVVGVEVDVVGAEAVTSPLEAAYTLQIEDPEAQEGEDDDGYDECDEIEEAEPEEEVEESQDSGSCGSGSNSMDMEVGVDMDQEEEYRSDPDNADADFADAEESPADYGDDVNDNEGAEEVVDGDDENASGIDIDSDEEPGEELYSETEGMAASDVAEPDSCDDDGDEDSQSRQSGSAEEEDEDMSSNSSDEEEDDDEDNDEGSSDLEAEPVEEEPVQFGQRSILEELQSSESVFPDSIADHFLHGAGFESSDPRISHLISLAAQKYLLEILKGAHTVSMARATAAAAVAAVSGGGDPQMEAGGNGKCPIVPLTLEDLESAIKERGLDIQIMQKPFS